MTDFSDRRKQIEGGIIALLLILTVSYGVFKAYPLVTGPKIEIITPFDGDEVASTTFQISGIVTRSKEITLQGKPITIDDHGNFTETLVAYYPYTILVLVATDKYRAT